MTRISGEPYGGCSSIVARRVSGGRESVLRGGRSTELPANFNPQVTTAEILFANSQLDAGHVYMECALLHAVGHVE